MQTIVNFPSEKHFLIFLSHRLTFNIKFRYILFSHFFISKHCMAFEVDLVGPPLLED